MTVALVAWWPPAQEHSQERYEKLLAPKLGEEAAQQLKDEAVWRKRRAEIMNSADAEALDRQCTRLLQVVDVSRVWWQGRSGFCAVSAQGRCEVGSWQGYNCHTQLDF